ncbi:MAG: transcriptional pleiotropic repressor [Clostridiales bacterium]|nr:transcriptional pleiotropic repressor [Clostridiales bacterium]
MESSILSKMRKLNHIVQTSGATQLSFGDLCRTMMNVLDSNVYVVSKKGKILGVSLHDSEDSAVINTESGEQFFNAEDQAQLLKVDETLFNITEDRLLELFKNDIASYSKFVTVVPIIGNAQRLGTLVLARRGSYLEEDLILAEYAATIIGLEIIRAKNEEHEEGVRKKAIVQMAISTLSYSEFEAMVHIFEELDGEEGLLVASKIADKAGITRSVIVNALRKFESAGVIETRSLGMKGTYIRILNDRLMEELNKIRQ